MKMKRTTKASRQIVMPNSRNSRAEAWRRLGIEDPSVLLWTAAGPMASGTPASNATSSISGSSELKPESAGSRNYFCWDHRLRSSAGEWTG